MLLEKAIFKTKSLLDLPEKLISYTCPKKLRRFISEVLLLQLCVFDISKLVRVLSKIISHSLFVKRFGFSMFYNDIFFQLAFVLYAQEDFHFVCKHILAFYFFLCLKDFKSFHELFLLEVFTCFHFNI